MGWIPSLFGGATPPLKPQGPAPFAQPPEQDRRALFWWLKRNTSYTAIEHNAKLWTVFAGEWERWMRSQDDPPNEDIQTFKHIVDSQLCYERGLKGLRKGDRSVFNDNSSDGWLRKKNLGLIRRRLEWYGTPEEMARAQKLPLSMVRSYYVADDAAVAITFSEAWYEGMGFPDGSARQLLAALPFDTTLPEPRWDVSFSPGRRSSKDGIYEQVDLNGQIVGGMTYFIKGQPSDAECSVEYGPNAWTTTKARTTDFVWRLLWEDTRYKDGVIPDEEQHYLTPSESVAAAEAAKQAVTASLPRRCEANHPCPREGYWYTPAKTGSRRWFKQGEVMPEFISDYGSTIWQWDDTQS